MVVTVAATTPVVAASRVPTSTTARARPPRTRASIWPIASSSRSAMPDFSSMAPMNTKAGIASNVKLLMIPKMRCGKALRNWGSISPSAMPSRANSTETPPSPKATGKPLSRAATSARAIAGPSHSPGSTVIT